MFDGCVQQKYTDGRLLTLPYMEKTLTTRELFKQFSMLKKEFLARKLDTVFIPLGKNQKLKLTIEKEQTPFEDFLEGVAHHPLPLIERPDFDLFSHE